MLYLIIKSSKLISNESKALIAKTKIFFMTVSHNKMESFNKNIWYFHSNIYPHHFG